MARSTNTASAGIDHRPQSNDGSYRLYITFEVSAVVVNRVLEYIGDVGDTGDIGDVGYIQYRGYRGCRVYRGCRGCR